MMNIDVTVMEIERQGVTLRMVAMAMMTCMNGILIMMMMMITTEVTSIAMSMVMIDMMMTMIDGIVTMTETDMTMIMIEIVTPITEIMTIEVKIIQIIMTEMVTGEVVDMLEMAKTGKQDDGNPL